MSVAEGGDPVQPITFLFTDIEGSTRRWEDDSDAMQSALALHDEVLRSAIEANGGSVFKHTGDGMCAAFTSAQLAIDAAVDAQRVLELPVRMGLASGSAQVRDGDYFGPVLNRAARVMSAGHGGQIVVADSTARLADGSDLVDLGAHRLRDLSDAIRLFQVYRHGLKTDFLPLRTMDASAGNLPVRAGSFIGRDEQVMELIELVRANRLVTLTGVGGVGKTRMAMHLAAELSDEFPGGAWIVELAAVSEPATVPDVVASALGITPEPGQSVIDSVAAALSGRQVLVLLDNCEHVLAGAGDVVEAVLARSNTVKLIATSREGLGVAAEHLWPVPPLDVRAGSASAAVELFIERAHAVNPGFDADDPAELAAVIEICERLDGIALGIELAAARMVSMSARGVRERLGDRFRLLSGRRRGLEHHQTLRQAVAWSYDLLEPDERDLLNRCAVFSNGFDLAAAGQVCGDRDIDEYAALDLLDSLVRKSLITLEPVSGHSRYGMLETIRQYAHEELAAAGTLAETRDLHASFFAAQVALEWDAWNGPQQRAALDWVILEFANLRAGFRWSVDNRDLFTATTIAAHTALLGFTLQRFEAVGWAEEILAAATSADLAQLPRLYIAASICALTARPEDAIDYARTAGALEADPRYDSIEPGWSGFWEGIASRYAGRVDRWFEICSELADQEGLARLLGLVGMLTVPAAVGRPEEAKALAEETMIAARSSGNPYLIAFALAGYGRALAQIDPPAALAAMRQGLDYAREQRLSYFEATIAREVAGLEAVHGELDEALELFDNALDSFHRAGNHGSVATTFANLAVLFDRLEKPEVAATIYGNFTQHAISSVMRLPEELDHLRSVLGEAVFDTCVAAGHSMEFSEGLQYARNQIQLARLQL